MNQAIVLVSFGVSDIKQREKCIEPLAAEIRDAFYDYMVYEAYTSDTILKYLKGEGAFVFTLAEVLDRLIDEKYDRVIIQPTHLIDGAEYRNKIVAVYEQYKAKFKEIVLGQPAFVAAADDGANDEGLKYVIGQIAGSYYEKAADETLVLVGHGATPTNHIYERLQEAADAAGTNALIGVWAAGDKPALADVIARLKDKGAKKVYLAPLFLVAGTHVSRDLAGDLETSWKKQLEAAGFAVNVWLDGLGANMEFRGLYMQRIIDMIGKLDFGG